MLWTLRRRTERGNYEVLEFPLQPINTREPLRYNVRCSQSIIPAYRFRGLWAIGATRGSSTSRGDLV